MQLKRVREGVSEAGRVSERAGSGTGGVGVAE